MDKGAEQIVPMLLKKGAKVDAADKYGKTPLNNHAAYGNIVAVRALLDAGAKVDNRGNEQQTPLLLAAINGHEETVTELLARHADPNLINSFGATPLMAAAGSGHLVVVQRLHAAGATLGGKLVKGGQSALELAIEGDHAEVAGWLLDHGMADRLRSRDESAPLMVAAFKGSLKSIALLVARGADPNLLITPSETYSLSPLMGACATEHEAAARALIDAGARVNLSGKGGASALHIAAAAGNLACVQLLLAKGATLEARNDANGTALRSASEMGHLAIVKLLLSKGAKPDIVDAMGLLPIDYARKGGHAAIVEALSAAK